MRLTKTNTVDNYSSEAGELKVDVFSMNNGTLFKITRLISGSTTCEQINLNEEKLKALIDLYYEVRPDTGCRRAWKREACNSYDDHVWDTICKRCGSES